MAKQMQAKPARQEEKGRAAGGNSHLQPKISSANRPIEDRKIQKQVIARKHDLADYAHIPRKGWYFA